MGVSDEPRTVRAVQITLETIGALQEAEQIGVTDLASRLDRSKGTVHSHLNTLYENEHVVKRDGEYALSLKYLELGETVKERIQGYGIVCEEIDDLAEKSGELAQFATMEHGKAVYVYKSGGENAVQTASSPGKREYPHCISLGKAMLATLPQERAGGIVDSHGLKQYTENTITSRERLHEELEAIRDRGFAYDEEERIEGIRCVAAPLQADGEILGAISVSGPSTRMDGDWFREEIPNLVTRSANVIEINTKFA